jgi:hypothetical protein
MKNRLYAWCELDDKIEKRDPEDLFRCNTEGGWISEGWVDQLDLDHAVEIRTTGRHYALETWAPNKVEAHRRFMMFRIYKECQE